MAVRIIFNHIDVPVIPFDLYDIPSFIRLEVIHPGLQYASIRRLFMVDQMKRIRLVEHVWLREQPVIGRRTSAIDLGPRDNLKPGIRPVRSRSIPPGLLPKGQD